MDSIEATGQILNNWRTAKLSGQIPVDMVYRPAISRVGGKLSLYCKDANGNKLGDVLTVEVDLSENEKIRLLQEKNLEQALRDQLVDLNRQSTQNISLSEPIFWLTWGECFDDLGLICLFALLLVGVKLGSHFNWKLVQPKDFLFFVPFLALATWIGWPRKAKVVEVVAAPVTEAPVDPEKK
ncbi:MAG: hypothetical protein HY225_02065 [Candidatus Vogelbacteria bacterium]|nr:hypothetical protein [Candidatus Vogelbacteria bacterium]